ncbi:2-keto-4-pentenoate hydratase/2-oxohepta-3-ene-1,7-dioic acid hydratase in catechol pathway/NAD(P)-dependent dehydrogenase (short-subunit alcohol dehydrogenase family) [Microbacterium natoriense]|uniref:2-keto-4-pentenoate hydratase/2-oxohepta-3-ene-1,7-dioic acid hydratase in catechol pathway/NAD(P)-dependent dehydrogenase (Short-subunit alcohol dehydrogenase family) n=1 Tax=Microbacterium natoriense TaxID=284570 RepID=A0AAW8EUA7_9MICO|nr:SDR family oxidoreductase [Microbacterium natoriense]MDQ0646214.1 2-keto-4-pentenoate hydratase/2-oxohepta-3-ene-1,7-dioic acid hydratase in catechol pathway/NAD(P)-dependent dehydrogenase (short-subunit alcohol dehydrogenase family) [Microbacterium natoriense]
MSSSKSTFIIEAFQTLLQSGVWFPKHLGEASMRLMRIGAVGAEKPSVLLDADNYVDLSDLVHDFDEEFFGSGGVSRITPIVAERARAGAVNSLGSQRIGAPIARPHQIICVGLNFADHAAESGQAVPEEPILFSKSPNTIVGPNDDVRLPRGSTKADWEVELGIVIGSRASYLDDPAQVRDHIAGYMLVNDISERAFQLERGGQWLKGKSAETFNPAGPWLATPDEFENILSLDMWLDVNGIRRQVGSTATMIFDPYVIVHYVSQFLVLEPGDLINTGTPPGVGLGFDPADLVAPGRRHGTGHNRAGHAAASSHRVVSCRAIGEARVTRALITGAGRGLGAAAADRLERDGIEVIRVDIGGDDVLALDVTDEEAVSRMADRVGPVDILINSAGVVGPNTPLLSTTADQWRSVLDVNVLGTVATMRAFIPAMVERGWGRVVNLASMAGKDGNPNLSVYSASKAAVIALTKSAGKELATTGVLVNAVAPAVISTPMNQDTAPDVLAHITSLIPMKRVGTPAEVAELIAWLSSGNVSFSTGAVYDISGGRATY